jgi:signal transduction histidine kinase
LVGYALLVVVLGATLHDAPRDLALAEWLIAYAALAVAFYVGASAAEHQRPRRYVALVISTSAMLAMATLLPCYFGALSLAIVASQAASVLSGRRLALLIAAQTLALGGLLLRVCPLEDTIASMLALLGFEAFAAVAVLVTRREMAARRVLAHANAELLATRALLDDACRAHERTRISRELHDVLGHDLTALGLQLEIASHVSHDQAVVHLDKARDATARLLHNVREVVAAMRVTDGSGLHNALRILADGTPSLNVQLAIPDDLRLDGAHAHCVLRCVQEVITNTLRHARASNLWIAIAQDTDAVTVDAHDDGCGAATNASGGGLRGMRDRIAELGGVLNVERAPSFAVRATLPVPAR